MAEHGAIARPYAQAVFEIAKADADFSAWSDFLKLAATIIMDADVTPMLFTPGVDLEGFAVAIADICRERLAGPALLRDGERSTGTSFLKLLGENQRLAVLPDVAARFEVLRAEAENTLDVVLTSASPVSDGQQASIVTALGKRFGRRIRLTVKLEPALIGGARLQVGDRVIDGSVRTGLDKLATALRA